MFGIIGSIANFDLQNAIFLTFLIFGFILFFLALCGGCIAWKRFCVVQCFFSIFITLAFIFFYIFGISLLILTTNIGDALDKACDPTENGDVVEAFRELYVSANTIYCVSSSTGCECYSDGSNPNAAGVGYTAINSSSTVVNVQSCTDHLEQAYANYGIDFDSTSDLAEFLGHFGTIEKEFKCSGICTLQNRYYFSDINIGVPEKTCIDVIKDELVLGEVRGFGIGYTVTACILFLIWFVQYGLCCRAKEAARQGNTKQF